MRTSKRFVIVTLITICVIGGTAAIGTKLITNRQGDAAIERKVSSGMIRNEYHYEDFESVLIEGAWKVDLKRGDFFSIAIHAPSVVLEKAEIEKRNDTLRLITDKWTALKGGTVSATITMPNIREISSAGGSKVSFTDFTCDKLILDIEGACSIIGVDNTIEHLELQADGAVSVNLKKSMTTNAQIRLAGAGSVDITMDGGELIGGIEGVGSLNYYGKVARENIRTEGLSSVHHK